MASKQSLEAPKEIGKKATVALAILSPNPANRKTAADEDIKTLAASIKEVGLLYPIIVEPHPDKPKEYRIIAGERRFRALKRLGIEAAPCVIVSDEENSGNPAILGVVENHQRKVLTPMEEAAAVRGLLDQGLEPESVARSLGRTRAWVARRASLTDLSEKWLAELAHPESKIAAWPPSHLELISRFPLEVQDRMLEEWASQWRWNMPTLRDLQLLTGDYLHLLAQAPWKLDDDTLCPEAGACAACPKRSSHHPDLFEEELEAKGKVIKGDRCLDAVCWDAKAAVYLRRRIDEGREEHPNLALLDAGEGEEGPPLQSASMRIVYPSNATPCRKSDKNAVPVLVVRGPGLGRVKWVHLPRQKEATPGKNAHPAKAAGDETPAEPAEKTAAQKKEPYDRRRCQVVIDAVRKKLEALAKVETIAEAEKLEGGRALVEGGIVAKTLLLLGILLEERGWRKSAHDPFPEPPEGLAWETLSSLSNAVFGKDPASRELILGLCWFLLRHCLRTLAQRLSLFAGERSNEAHYADAQRICAMLGFNLAALRAQAAEAVPYAKSWRESVEDDWIGSNGSEGGSHDVPETVTGPGPSGRYKAEANPASVLAP